VNTVRAGVSLVPGLPVSLEVRYQPGLVIDRLITAGKSESRIDPHIDNQVEIAGHSILHGGSGEHPCGWRASPASV